MLELFTFSLIGIATSIRFIIVAFLFCWAVLLLISFAFRTSRAISLGRFLLNVGGRIKCQEIPKYIMYCYGATKWDIKKTWENGNYWEGVGKWRYLDKEKGKYVKGKYLKNK